MTYPRPYPAGFFVPRLRSNPARLGPPFLVGTVLAVILAPKAAAWLLPLIAAMTVLVFAEGHPPSDRLKTGQWITGRWIIGTSSVFALAVLLSSIWSADWVASTTAAALFVGYFCCAWWAADGMRFATPEIIDRLAASLPIAVAAGSTYLLIELLSDSAIQKFLFTHIPLIRPKSPQHVGMLNDKVVFLALDELNRGVAVANLLLWPALLVLVTSKARMFRRLALPLAALVLAVTVLSSHETSKIAIVLGVLAYAAHRLWPKGACSLVVAGWLIATLLVVPIVERAYQCNLHIDESIPVNGRARIVLWAATAELIHNRPFLGVGANSTRALAARNKNPEIRPGHVIEWRTGMHAHNIYLQTWYEMGFVGALLLAAAGLAILDRISRLSSTVRPFILGAFVSAASIGAFSWGMWQPWFVASYFLTALLCLIAMACVRVRVVQ